MKIAVIAAVALVIVLIMVAFGGVGGALALENQDSFCASCHTEPEVTYYQQSLQGTPVTLAAFHTQKQTACIDCHSGGGILGRSKGLMQGFDDLVMYYSGNYRRPAVTTNPLDDDSCVKCHNDVFVRRRGFNRQSDGHYHAFLPRWQAVDGNAAHCEACHPSHTQGSPSHQFLVQQTVVQTCDQCHAKLGRED